MYVYIHPIIYEPWCDIEERDQNEESSYIEFLKEIGTNSVIFNPTPSDLEKIESNKKDYKEIMDSACIRLHNEENWSLICNEWLDRINGFLAFCEKLEAN